MEQELRLNEFKTLYKAWKRGIPWWDHLLLGFLWWVEEKFIDYRIETEVTKAIEEVVLPPVADMVTPVYSEVTGEGSLGVSELRLTAPWYVEADKEVEGVTDASRDQ